MLLLILGAIVWGAMPRWRPEGSELLSLTRFRDLAGWQTRPGDGRVEVAGGHLVLERDDPGGNTAASYRFDLGFAARTLRVEAEVTVRDVETRADAEPWDTASVGLMGRRPDGRYDVDRPIYLLSLRGTHQPQAYRQTFELAADATRALLFVRLRNVRGRIELANLRVVALQERPVYSFIAGGLGALWTLFLGGAAWRFVRGAARPRAALVGVGLVALALLASLWPDGSVAPLHRLTRVAVGDPRFDLNWLDRAAHFIVFATLAAALRRARPEDPAWLQLGPLLAIGTGVELVQGFAGGLGFDDIFDAAVNGLGIVTGRLLVGPRRPRFRRGHPRP